MFCYPTHIVLKLWLVSEACARFGQDRQSGALELILATPVKVEELLRGQWLSLRRQFFWPTVFVLCAEFGYLLAHGKNDDWVLTVVVYMATSVLDYWALGWMGMWTGMTARKITHAARSTVARVLVLPWLIWLGCGLFGMFRNSLGGSEAWMIFWGMLSGGIAFGCGAYARDSLHTRFREVATAKVMAK